MSDLSADEFRRLGHQVIDWVADYLDAPEKYPVLSRIKPGELMDALPAHGPEIAESMDTVLADFERLILPAVTHWNHPGFLAYFATSSSTPGILGELLTAALNSNAILWRTGPAVTELEVVTLNWVREWMGLPEDNFGLIFDTASVSSLHAIAAARELVAPEVRTTGRSEKRLILYCSDQAHSSIEKAAIALGIGQQNVRKMAVDQEFRMDVVALEAAVREDMAAGHLPFCVVATVGTTSTTSIDPVAAIALVSKAHGMWLHVDCAYAGSAAILPEFRYILEGANHADSLVVNAHKWLFTPMDCSILYTRKPEILRRAFALVPEYLRTLPDPRVINLMEYALPLGRRFRALKLWFILRSGGREGLARLIRGQIALAQEFAAWVAADDRFELSAPHPLSVICFRLKGSDAENQMLVDAVNATGEAFVAPTVLRGQLVIRVAIGNLRTSRETLERVWRVMLAAV